VRFPGLIPDGYLTAYTAAMWPVLLLAPTLHLPVEQHTLASGLQVILLVDRRTPLVATELTYRVGAAEDRVAVPGFSGCPGMAHLVEHLLFEGEYDALLAEAGGESNAWTSHDWLTLTAAAPADALERLLYLESRRMAEPLAGVSQDDLDNQIAVVLSERSLERSGGRGGRALAESLYPPGHPLSAPVLGDPDALAEVSLSTVSAFLSAWAQPGNAILVIGGDIDPVATLAHVERWFGGLTAASPPPRVTLPPPEAVPARRVLHENTTPTAMLAWRTVPRGHPDEPALDMLAELITDRLARRVATGRLDEARAWTENGRLDGRLVLSAAHLRRSSRALHRELRRALAGVLDHPVDPAALARHGERWRMWYVRAAQPLEARVRLAAGCARGGLPADCVEGEIAAREAVTPEQLADVARRYLLDREPVQLSVTPPGRSVRGAVEVDPL
jgi:zinc protease